MATLSDINRSQALQDKGIGKEFQNVHRKLEEHRSYIDGRFQLMDDRFQLVDNRFQALEAMAMKLEGTQQPEQHYPY
jgi:hypothetical protein